MRVLVSSLLVIALSGCATPRSTALETHATLDGAWVVDLSASPAEPYAQPMRLQLNPDGSVSGSFYESEMEAGRWRFDRGRICVSFRTSDGAGPYHSSACLVGELVQGQTWAEHR